MKSRRFRDRAKVLGGVAPLLGGQVEFFSVHSLELYLRVASARTHGGTPVPLRAARRPFPAFTATLVVGSDGVRALTGRQD